LHLQQDILCFRLNCVLKPYGRNVRVSLGREKDKEFWMERRENDVISAVTDLPPWDEQMAKEATGGDADLARELVQALVQGLAKELVELRSCLDTNDLATLGATTHRLRGATSYCGVPALDACLGKLELSAKSGDKDRIEPDLARVEEEAERLIHAIQS
jgi:HPt (histidine-containing phosphotransfer) domain-containing protein